jgi:hypothetical protein
VIDIRLIDFDYCGRAGRDHYPPDWDPASRHTDAKGGALMEKEHDEVMFDNLFWTTTIDSGKGMFRGLV